MSFDSPLARKLRVNKISLLALLSLVSLIALVTTGLSAVSVHATAASITTDQSDYMAGSIVTITGTGFSANSAVTVSVTDPNSIATTWSVTSDQNGGFTTTYQLDDVFGNYLATATDGANSASTTFHDAAAAANIDQCTNGAVGATPESCLNSLANWVNGNANGNKAHWREGDFIAYRVTVTGATAGSHNIQFSWDTVHSKGHAIDYIGSVNFTETFSLTPSTFNANNNNPCTDKLPSAQCSSSLTGFNSASNPVSSIAIPTANEATAATCDSATGTFSGSQTPGKIFIWGPTGTTLTGFGYASENVPSGTGQCTTTGSLNFTIGGSASSNAVVIAWGGHIASQINWGFGNSASAINGSPYHTSLISLDGASVGSQDRALSTTAIFFQPSISTAIFNAATNLPLCAVNTQGTWSACTPSVNFGTTVYDNATFALGTISSGATGTVTFQLRNGGTCTGSVIATSTSPVSGGKITSHSAPYTTNAVGSFSFNATYSGDTQDFKATSACEPFTVVPHANAPIVSKTATGTYTTTYKWTITKSVDKTLIYTAGGSAATFNYQVKVTPDSGTISGISVSGTITVSNPNPFPMSVNVTDILSDGTVCSVTGGLMAAIPASSPMSFPYACSDGNSVLPSSNTAFVAWSAGGTSGPAQSPATPISWTQTLVDNIVTVTDTLGGPLGTCNAVTNPSGCTFTYSKTFTDPAGTCTSHDNTATFTTNTTGTTGSAGQTVTDCQGADLMVSKTATAFFTRTFHWGISKTVDSNKLFTAGGSPATFNFHVTVTNTGFTDSAWFITGTITVTNPNNWEAITLTSLSDSATGGVCTVAPGPYVVPASSSINVGYSCTFGSGVGGTNTATATWDSSTYHTPTGSASGSAMFSFATPTTLVDTSVTVTDSVFGPLGSCSVSTSPCTFNYSVTYTDPAGTCASHDNTATFTTSDTGTKGSASQTVTDCQGADLTVSKTASPTFTRTFHWAISKAADQTSVFTAGGAPVTVNYTVSVSHDSGTDSLWAITGMITVTNPNNWESITFNLADSAGLGSSCSIAGPAGPYTIAASSSLSFAYSCTFTSGASGTNTATATWDASTYHTPDASASGSAPFAFTTPTTIVDGSVTVTDTNVGTLGTVSYTDLSPKVFTYSKTFTDPAGVCTSHANTATFTTNTTGTTGSASVTVTDCQGADLIVSKTATPTFTRTFTWGISKSVDNPNPFTAGGASVTSTYTVSVTHDSGTDSAWAISGTITVTNPNNWEAITLTGIIDTAPGGSCTVTPGTMTVPASSSITFTYSCTFSSGAGGINTATATWDASAAHTSDASATGTASFSFTTPTTIVDGGVLVTDSQAGMLGTVSYTDPSPTVFTYTKTFTDPAGTCTSHVNTAMFTTNTTGTTGSASQTVTDCQGADLTVSKTASPTFTRTFTWNIAKSVNTNNVFTAGGSPATLAYDVTVTHDAGTDSAWAITGMITVTNPNDWESITFNLADSAGLGSSCSVAGPAGPYTVGASSSLSFAYSCTFTSGASGTNIAIATWDSSVFHTPDASASGSASFAFTTPTTIVDGSVTVTDSVKGFLGTVSYTDPSPTNFTYTQTFTDPAGTCTVHPNTATFTTNTTGTTGSASQTVTDCQGADLTVSKTATPTFTRTFTWGISKSADQTSIFTAGGAPATVNYVVSVTHDSGTDSAWAISGTITVTNPNNWEGITFNLADNAGLGSTCSITGGTGPYTVPASNSMSFAYSCTFTSGASGTNTATATWDSSAFHTPDASASGSAPFAFTTPSTIVDGSVTVTDSQAGALGTVSYTDPSPTTFTYSKTFTDPAGVCTNHANTATFTTNTTGTTGSASVTVTDCQGADLTVSKTATPTFTRTFHWAISKAADQTSVFTAGGAPVTVNYTVSVTHDSGTDSVWAITGMITVTNPNNWESITFNLADSAGLGSSCSITGGTGPYTIAAGATQTYTYSCTFTSGASGTNTAIATWDSSVFHTPSGSASGTAPFAFTTPTTIVDGSVTVTDSVQGVLGTVSYTDPSPTTFAYSQTFTDPAGICTSHPNTASFTTNTTGTTGSSSVTVTDCQGADLTVSKTATATFTRTFAWSISKSVDKTLVYLSQGGTATFTYTVSVTHDSGTDSAWQVTGAITVHNPNNWESVTLTGVTDAVNDGGVCTVSGNTAQTIAPLGNSVGLTYMCTYTSQPAYNTSATNTATATWDGSTAHTPNSSASGTATFSFTSPTTIVDGSVTVTDTLFGGTLGTASATGAACTHTAGVTCTDVAGGTNFVYQHTVTPPSGTCVTANNTATFTTNTTGKTGSASRSVEACVVVATITTKVSPSMLSMPGTTAKDNATVALTPSGQTVSGTVTFKVYGPFSSAPTSGSCTGSFTTIGPVAIGPGVSPQSVISPPFTPSAMGYYAFVATYTPTGVANGNTVSTACGDPGETLLVAPTSQVTNTSFCPIAGNQFPLNLITDPQNPGSFQLVSTNPGQFYDNVFYFNGAGNPVSLVIGIPFPFVTQGAVPIQVSSSFGIVNGCFSPSFDATSQFTITATGGTLSTSGNPIIVLGDYPSQQLGQYVYITVTGTVPSTGLVYVTVHIAYGLLKQDFNKVTTGTASGTPAGISCTVNPCAQWTANPSVIIGSPEPYAFTVTGNLTTTYTITSVNNFKKDPGFAGVITRGDGSAVVGATVKIYDSTGTLLGITTTDQNGVYLFAYKYTGPSTTFTVKVTSPTGATQTTTVTMKSNQLALTNFQFS